MDDLNDAPSPINRVLIANRGEIARRIIRTCRRLGIASVAVHSDADRDAPYVSEADRAVALPGNTPAETYLDVAALLAAATSTGCDAVHPGYGFLAENAAFAEAVLATGLRWIGPPQSAILAMGSKIGAKALMRAAGVPVLPDNSVEPLASVGLPALVKASAGGGGRGMRLVSSATELEDAIIAAGREAQAAFGDGTVFVERYVDGGRHVEIQVFADDHGNVVSLFERDCTLQRRHQKILEESPSPAVDDALRTRMSSAAVEAARAVDYRGAGTVEFLLDRNGEFWFLEMNTRLQVEHPVTELLTGLDLVELQLLVAAGGTLPEAALHPVARGHAIEVRLCAEDPTHGYLPTMGRFHEVRWPRATGVRVDSGIETGSVVSPYYDSMLAKLIAHAPTRVECARRLREALEATVLIGPTTNRDQLVDLLRGLIELDDTVDTAYLDRNPPRPVVADPGLVAAAAVAVADRRAAARTVLALVPAGWRNNRSVPQEQRLGQDGEHVVHFGRDRSGNAVDVHVDGVAVAPQRTDVVVIDEHVHVACGARRFAIPPRYEPPDEAGRAGSLVAPMPGSVLRVFVAAGDPVTAGQALVTLEAMKMEHTVVAPASGVVAEVLVQPGQQLDSGQPLVRIEQEAT
ncbi:MAG: accA [Ilumatobacteraceae bacterium]|nr:accA [Ilumatobacteraceae bacterium]